MSSVLGKAVSDSEVLAGVATHAITGGWARRGAACGPADPHDRYASLAVASSWSSSHFGSISVGNGWSGDGAAGPGVVQGYKKGRISKRDELTVQFETEEKPLVICLSKMEGAWEVIEVPAAASTPRILELSAALGAIPAPSFGACLDVLWQLLVPFYDSLLLHAHVTQRGS